MSYEISSNYWLSSKHLSSMALPIWHDWIAIATSRCRCILLQKRVLTLRESKMEIIQLCPAMFHQMWMIHHKQCRGDLSGVSGCGSMEVPYPTSSNQFRFLMTCTRPSDAIHRHLKSLLILRVLCLQVSRVFLATITIISLSENYLAVYCQSSGI